MSHATDKQSKLLIIINNKDNKVPCSLLRVPNWANTITRTCTHSQFITVIVPMFGFCSFYHHIYDSNNGGRKITRKQVTTGKRRMWVVETATVGKLTIRKSIVKSRKKNCVKNRNEQAVRRDVDGMNREDIADKKIQKMRCNSGDKCMSNLKVVFFLLG